MHGTRSVRSPISLSPLILAVLPLFFFDTPFSHTKQASKHAHGPITTKGMRRAMWILCSTRTATCHSKLSANSQPPFCLRPSFGSPNYTTLTTTISYDYEKSQQQLTLTNATIIQHFITRNFNLFPTMPRYNPLSRQTTHVRTTLQAPQLSHGHRTLTIASKDPEER